MLLPEGTIRPTSLTSSILWVIKFKPGTPISSPKQYTFQPPGESTVYCVENMGDEGAINSTGSCDGKETGKVTSKSPRLLMLQRNMCGVEPQHVRANIVGFKKPILLPQTCRSVRP